MKILKGALTYCRFKPTIKDSGAAAPTILPSEILERLAANPFQPFPDGWRDEGVRVGWCEAGEPFEPPTTDAVVDSLLAIGMRVDKFAIPAAMVKREVKAEAKRQCALGRDRLSAKELKELKKIITSNLRQKLGPVASDYELVWSFGGDGTVRLFTKSETQAAQLYELFYATFGLCLDPISIDEVYAAEFLLWLWCNAECNPAGAVYGLEKELRLCSSSGSATFKTDAATSPGQRDARTAVAIGRQPTALIISLHIPGAVPFDAHVSLNLSGVAAVAFQSIPVDAANDADSQASKQADRALAKAGLIKLGEQPEEAPKVKVSRKERDDATLLERMGCLAQVEAQIDALYGRFRELRDDARKWSRIRSAIDLWIAGDTSADHAYAEALEVDL